MNFYYSARLYRLVGPVFTEPLVERYSAWQVRIKDNWISLDGRIGFHQMAELDFTRWQNWISRDGRIGFHWMAELDFTRWQNWISLDGRIGFHWVTELDFTGWPI